MKATELRIGNWILFEDDHHQVTEIKKRGVTGMERRHLGNEKFSMVYFNTKGVPLTEQWLKKFGFENEDSITFSKMIKYEDGEERKFIVYSEPYREGKMQEWGRRYWTVMGGSAIAYLPYVHTLQNAFSLTGKELKVKEDASIL